MNKNKYLDMLVGAGMIKKYHYLDLDDEGNRGNSDFRNTQQLSLIFPNDMVLIIDTFCSGSSEDTCMIFDMKKLKNA